MELFRIGDTKTNWFSFPWVSLW